MEHPAFRKRVPRCVREQGRGRRPDPLDQTITPILDTNGNISDFIATAPDVTDQVQTEAALPEPEPGMLLCTISDDGVGFDPSAIPPVVGERGFGLAGARDQITELGGTMQINSAPGAGTELVIGIPLEN